LAKQHSDLARSRNQVACRLHAVPCELVPGGFAGEITAGLAAELLADVRAWITSAANAPRSWPRQPGLPEPP
jgi:hypothetical protein